MVASVGALVGCSELEEDREPPRLISSSLPDGVGEVDPSSLAAIELRFSEAMREDVGEATLSTLDEAAPVRLRWSAPDTAVLEVAGALVVDRRYRLRLEQLLDVAGNPLQTEDVWPEGELHFSTVRVDLRGPTVESSSPAHLETEVYPAPVFGGTAPRVTVTLRFDEAMDPTQRQVTWGPQGGAMQAVMGSWTTDRRGFSFEIAGALSGRRPLEDRTGYQVSLQGLRDLAGNPATLDGQTDSLRFTTGTYDALLNHSCGHVLFGPFVALTAAASPSPQAPRSDAAHTRYTVSLPGAAPFSGATRLRAPANATWHLFLDGDLPISVLDAQGQPLALTRAVTPRACDGISHSVTFALAELDQVSLIFGPQPAATARFIVEQVAVEAQEAP